MKTMWQSMRVLLVLSVLTGIVYPLVITALSQAFFRAKADGSIIRVNGAARGSELVGQEFISDRYFWSRPSATDYDPLPSAGTNLGPTSAALLDSVEARAARFGKPVDSIPAELLLASGSGLDPDLSPEAAMFQADRVIRARGLPASDRARIDSLVRAHIELRQLGFLGEPRVNVLKLNLALDSLVPQL